jgi:hypothetical protein
MGRTRTGKQKLAAIAAAGVAVAGGGAAIAATGTSSPAQESQAVLDAAAQNLGVTSTKLSEALKAALVDRVDAKLKAGTITEAEATALKARINSDSFALFGGGLGGPRGGGFGHHGADLAVAATYLGVTEAQLRADLQSGTSLAAVVKATDGKSVDGLVAALVASEKERLAKAVADGKLTEAQQSQILASLDQRIADVVNGVRPAGGPGDGRGGPGGGPPGDAPDAALPAA